MSKKLLKLWLKSKEIIELVTALILLLTALIQCYDYQPKVENNYSIVIVNAK